MSYNNDRKFSDEKWNNNRIRDKITKILGPDCFVRDISLNSRIKKFYKCNNPKRYHFYKWFDSVKDQMDKNNSIDSKIIVNSKPIPVQYRFQKNNRGKDFNWALTLRYERPNSSLKKQKKSEWYKIKENKKVNKPYPKYLIWGLINENENNIIKLLIIDLENFIYDYSNGYYYINKNKQNEDNLKFGDDDVGLFEVIEYVDNIDGSSSFITLYPHVIDEQDKRMEKKSDYRRALVCNLTFD